MLYQQDRISYIRLRFQAIGRRCPTKSLSARRETHEEIVDEAHSEAVVVEDVVAALQQPLRPQIRVL